MEIKNKHQLMIAGGLILLVSGVYWPPKTFGATERFRSDVTNPLRRSAQNVRSQLQSAASALHVAEQVEAALRDYEETQLTDGLAVIVGDGVPGSAADYVRQQMRSHWESVATPRGTRVIVAVNLDVDDLRQTWRARAGDGYHVVPVMNGAEPACVLLINLTRGSVARLETQPGRLQRILRPGQDGASLGLSACAFYAAFGQPGPAVRDWIDRTGGSLSGVGRWDGPDSPEAGDMRTGVDRFWMFRHPQALNCVGGKFEGCADAVLTPGGRQRMPQPGFRIRSGAYNSVFGESRAYYLADMVRELGVERFARFWSSDLPFEPAFESAAGETLGSYTHQWVTNTIGSMNNTGDLRYGRIALMAVVAGVSVVGAGWVGTRRTI